MMVVDEQGGRGRFTCAICKCYLAEGVVEGQSIFFASPKGSDAEEVFAQLPATSSTSSTSTDVSVPSASAGADFKIAWRYNTKVQETVRTASKFDLAKKAEKLGETEFSKRVIAYKPVNRRPAYEDVWKQLHSSLESHHQAGGGFLRILITDMGSPLWADPSNLSRFLLYLRGKETCCYVPYVFPIPSVFTRQANCIILLTADTLLLDECGRVDLLNCCDTYFQLEPVGEQQRKEMNAFQKFDGRFIIKKLASPYSIAPFHPECTDMVFDLTRHSFDINVLHLPPAIGRDGATDTANTMSCQRIQSEF